MSDRGAVICFGPFRLDLERGDLRYREQEVRLRRKAWGVLTYLAQRPGLTVSHREILDALWPGTAVTPNALGTTIWELRKALGTFDATVEYIQTVPRRGFRFLAHQPLLDAPPPPEPALHREAAALIGRREELGQLMTAWSRALAGQRQVVLIGGLPGVGKTTIASAAVECIRATHDGTIPFGRGQCLSLQGEAEPYLSILEVIEQLAGQFEEATFVELASRVAPTWLAQLPALLPALELDQLRRSLAASGAQRLLHDAVRLLENLALKAPLLLWLEDLQWADAATVDLLVAIAERTVPSRLMIVGTYRPIEAVLSSHPITAAVRSLCAHGKVAIIEVDGWPVSAVEQYLERRFDNAAITAALAARIERHTNGNPLYVQEVADHLVRTDYLCWHDGRWTFAPGTQPGDWSLPDRFQKIVGSWLARQPAVVSEVLGAASLIEGDFTVQEVAAATRRAELEVDTALSEVARSTRLIESIGVGRWPDLTMTQTYRFAHALYQRAVAEGVAPLRGRAWHQGIAERLEAGFQAQSGKVAARLAAHFHAAGDDAKSIDYLEVAAATDAARYAYAEARSCLIRVIEALQQFPPTNECRSRLARRRLDCAHVITIMKGIPDPEAKQLFQQAAHSVGKDGDELVRFRALIGLMSSFGYGGQLARAMEVGTELIDLAENSRLKLEPAAHVFVAMTESGLGKTKQAYQRVARVLAMEAEPNIPAMWDLHVGGTLLIAFCGALLGRRADVETAIADLTRRARENSFAITRVTTAIHIAVIHLVNREVQRARAMSEEALAIADEVEIVGYQVVARILHARAAYASEPTRFIAASEEPLRQRQSLGEHWWNSLFYGWLAEAYRDSGHLTLARQNTDAALALEERLFHSETLRIRATILAAQEENEAAETCLRASLDAATTQEAPAFILRSAVALSNLLRARGQHGQARDLLQPLCDRYRDNASVDWMEASAACERRSSKQTERLE